MGFFQYIESFFFLSLGITFILILLLVFHFRSRVNFLELKNDSLTRFCDVITNEIQVLKNMYSVNYNSFYNKSVPEIPDMSRSDKYQEEFEVIDHNEGGNKQSIDCYWESMLFCNNHNPNEMNIEPLVEEIKKENEILDIELSVDEIEELCPSNINQFVSNYIPNHENSVYNKIIVLDEDVLDNTDEMKSEEMKSEEIIEIEEMKSEETIETEKMKSEEIIIETEEKSDEIYIIKSDHEAVTSLIEDPLPLAKELSNMNYQKMNVQALRAYAISIGLCSDSSKYKKTELIKQLLEHDLENKK